MSEFRFTHHALRLQYDVITIRLTFNTRWGATSREAAAYVLFAPFGVFVALAPFVQVATAQLAWFRKGEKTNLLTSISTFVAG
jgi:hypothetical protein